MVLNLTKKNKIGYEVCDNELKLPNFKMPCILIPMISSSALFSFFVQTNLSQTLYIYMAELFLPGHIFV